MSPDHLLIAAVLRQTMQDLNKPGYKDEAYEWINSNSTEAKSFLWYCGHINMNPAVLRGKAKKLYMIGD